MSSIEAQQELSLQGLTEEEVLESRVRHGTNLLTPPKRDPWWCLFLEKFEDPIIRILLIAAAIAFMVGFANREYTEPIGIVMAIFLATTMAFLNEYKAGREFDILNQVSDDIDYRVIRGGEYRTVSKKDLVVGDVFLLEQGEEVPADASVLQTISLRIDESKITGESIAVPKYAPEEVPEGRKTETAYPVDHIYRGTMVREGHGVFRIVAVGDGTEIGKAAREAAVETDEVTPLNRQLEGLSKLIGVVGFGIATLLFAALSAHASATGEIAMSREQWIFTFIVIVSVLIALARVWLPIVYDFFDVIRRPKTRPEWLEQEGLKSWTKQLVYGIVFFAAALGIAWFTVLPQPFSSVPGSVEGRKFLQFFMIAITIIVVAVPEGLAMSVTLSLAYSMRKMTATNNLVRRMHACETIGAATVICTDKTGTLTKNEMSVFETRFPFLSGAPGNRHATFVYEGMAVNSTAHISRGEKVEALGNPTESALLFWLEARGVDYRQVRGDFQITEQLAFSTDRKFMTTRGLSPASGGIDILHVKGAPELVLARCATFLDEMGEEKAISEKIRENVLEDISSWQSRGMRVLGLAYRKGEGLEPENLEADSVGLCWLGFTAISDPVREEVPDAIKACFKAGIGVKIVTGDNQETASEIARQIGLLTEGDEKARLTGGEFEAMSDEELLKVVPGLKVLSRAKPQHKLRLVKTLQALNEVVAVTGDGTNDAPALNYANVGLAMGKAGTAVAKEASDIILLDDSFRSIVNAIMWGRSLYQNIQRFVLFQLTVNVAALFIALLGPFIGVELPLTVTQMLWVNLIMDTFAALALATEPPHWDVMNQSPRSPEAFIVTPKMWRNIFAYGVAFIVVLIALLLNIEKDGVTDYELSVFFNVFVMLQFWNLFNARCLGLDTSALKGFLSNRGFVCIATVIFIGQILITQFGGSAFRTTPLTARDFILIVAATSFVLWAGDLSRFLARTKKM
ncbi:MAG: calcium-translocating P-type ATPase, PMCA-type [Synergistaceae bacterium]|jgi:Ca2+-transporting ATPase|nr:calcium-translocating P-type ATPase, PMCA-type [Synergistaceae bacterium]